MKVRSVKSASTWVDRVGLALLFPKADIVLPSLWEAVNGSSDENWAVRQPDGTFVRWTKEMGLLWTAKDELPAQGLACVGKHLARVSACVAPRLLPPLCAQADREPGSDLERELIDAVRSEGPLTGPELRSLVGAPKRAVDSGIAALHRRLVLTSSHLVAQETGWGAVAHDLVDRKWELPKRLPQPETARQELARVVLAAAGELTAADLAGVFGWRRTLAADVLDGLAPSRDADGFRIWAAP
jgi:Winged helix DNA-binding domain